MVQSVERAFAILAALAGRTAGVTTLAARLGLPKSTVARLLATLQQLGAVERVDGARWRIGPGVAALAAGASAERGLAALVRSELVSLVADLGEDAGLALPDGYDVHYIDQVESANPVQVRDWTGTRAPMHATPSGLVLLAEWPADAIAGYLRRDLERLTPRTVVDPERLRARLAEVRERGHAWGLEEFAEGINSVAAPVRDARGQAIAAIHAHGPAYRFPARGGEARIAARIVAAADAVHRQLALDAA
jgi:DNA-binding IclR family transcriptional regulator